MQLWQNRNSPSILPAYPFVMIVLQSTSSCITIKCLPTYTTTKHTCYYFSDITLSQCWHISDNDVIDSPIRQSSRLITVIVRYRQFQLVTLCYYHALSTLHSAKLRINEPLHCTPAHIWRAVATKNILFTCLWSCWTVLHGMCAIRHNVHVKLCHCLCLQNQILALVLIWCVILTNTWKRSSAQIRFEWASSADSSADGALLNRVLG